MPKEGYKALTIKEETYNKAKLLKEKLGKKSTAKTVDELIEKKYRETITEDNNANQ